MLVNGHWTEEDQRLQNGVFVRAASTCGIEITEECLQSIVDEPGRFILFASYSCGWSHRVMLARIFKQVEDLVPLYIIGGKRMQGYPMNNNEIFRLPNTQIDIVYLHQLYSLHDKQYTGRATIPILWDSLTKTIVCNESSVLLRALNRLNYKNNTPNFYPVHLQDEIDRWNKNIYENLSNAVYRVGFSIDIEEKARCVLEIEKFLMSIEDHFGEYSFLVGEQLTEADLCIFPTLIRFDICYYALFKCSTAPLSSYKNIMSYARRIYQMPGVAQSVNFDVMYNASKENDIGDGVIILAAPYVDWNVN